MTTDSWAAVVHYLSTFEVYYPTISSWCSKVGAGIAAGNRSAFAMISTQGDIAGLAVTKNQDNAKLCHISVSEHARRDGAGALLMCTAIREMLSAGARHVHVTTGEEIAWAH